MNNLEYIKSKAPSIINFIFSDDMGYEFSAITQFGVIIGEPGMMINDYQGDWPFEISIAELNVKTDILNDFLNNPQWSQYLIKYDEINSELLNYFMEILSLE